MSTVGGGVNIVTDGLVLYLDAANTKSYPGSGTTWSDLSRSGNNGTLIGGPGYSGSNGGSIVFDGVNDYVTGSILNISVGCISMWINPNNTVNASSTFYPILTLRYTGIVNSEWYISLGPATSQLVNEYITVANAADGTRTGLADGGSLLANNWHNLVFNVESGTYKIYINGVKKTEITAAGGVSQLNIPNVIQIGALVRGVDIISYLGRISTTQIYNRALSATEIQQNYNATKTRFGL
jgi:hypothetical protein